MQALLFGATGFIGQEIFRELVKNSAHLGLKNIVLVSRSRDALSALDPESKQLLADRQVSVSITSLQWDVVKDDPSEYAPMLQSASHVFYAVQFPGHPVENPNRGLTYFNYDFGGLANVLRALGTSRGRRIYYMSGAGAGQGRSQPWFHAKDQAEAMLANYCAQMGSSFVALRPSLVYGKFDVSLNRFLNMARNFRIVPLFGKGDTLVQPVWVKDLAHDIVSLMFQHPEISGAYDFPGPEALAFRDLLSTLFMTRRVKAHFFEAPMGLVQFGAKLLESLPGQVLSQNAVEFLTTSVPMTLPTEGDAAKLFRNLVSRCKKPAEAFSLYSS